MVSEKEAAKKISEYESEYKDCSSEHLLKELSIIEDKCLELDRRRYEIKKFTGQECNETDLNKNIAFKEEQIKRSQECISIIEEQFDLTCHSIAVSNVLERQNVETKLFSKTQAWIIIISTAVLATCSVLDLIVRLSGNY